IRTQGTLDVAIDKQRGYFMYPYMENRLILDPTASLDANTIKIDHAQIDISAAPPIANAAFGGCSTSFSMPASALIEPAGSLATQVQVMLKCHAEAIKAAFEGGTYST